MGSSIQLFCFAAAVVSLTGLLVACDWQRLDISSHSLTGFGCVAIVAWGFVSLLVSGGSGGGLVLMSMAVGFAAFVLIVLSDSDQFDPQNELVVGGIALLPLGAQLFL